MKTTLLFLSVLTISVACETVSNNGSQQFIEPVKEKQSSIQPIKGLEIPERVFTIRADESNKIDLPNGGKIEIAENSLVDQKGNIVKGEVDIKWKEYHSLTDVILSGIPMKYDSAGVSHDFVSGGMFTISAEQNNEELGIKSGSTVDVDIASMKDDTTYSFYELNESTGDWVYEKTEAAKPMYTRKPEIEPVIIDAQVDTKAFPELKDKQIIGWKSLDRLSRSEMKAIKNDLSVVTLEREDKGYRLKFQRNKISKKINVEPYTVEEAMQNQNELKAELDQDYNELLTYQNNMAKGTVVRSIQIENFGTYNWDIKNKRASSLPLVAEFDYGKKVNKKLVSLFLVSPEENMIVKYEPDTDPNFSFDPKKKNFLIAIMPDNKIFAVKDEGFNKARKTPAGSHVTFEFDDMGVKVTSGEELGRNIFTILNQKS